MGDDAASVGYFDGEGGGEVEAVPGGGDLDGEVVAGLVEGAEGDGVAGLRAAGDYGNEGGEVGVGKLVDQGDEVVE